MFKRFLVFKGAEYYASGGWKDYSDSYDTYVKALEALAGSDQDWYQIVDTETGEVKLGDNGLYGRDR